MLSEDTRLELEKQKYRIVGSHSTVKVCGWTKKKIKREGSCYKEFFYGIQSEQCMQMSTSLSCANRCEFCWRGYKAPVSTEWKGEVGDPEAILEGCERAHHALLIGLKGFEGADKDIYRRSNKVKHVALSLTGEPIAYPKINDFIDLCHRKKISTFLVTNAQYHEEIKELRPVTQLYLSIGAPTKELLKDIEKPLFPDYWERLQKSLDELSRKKFRTAIRITAIKERNMILPEEYAALIKKGQPDFVEVKGYMFVGASRQRLSLKNSPLHEDVVEFSKEVVKHLPDYEIVLDHVASRVVLLAKKIHKRADGWHTWIDFDGFFKLIDNEEIVSEKYSRKTPKTGLSGVTTSDCAKKKRKFNVE